MKGHILITGGTGFVGGHLATGLIKDGYRVTTVSRGTGVNESHICADLTHEETVVDLARKLSSVDTVIHCAAIAHGEKPREGYSTADFNSLIVNNILKAFDRHKLRWIFMSSISVYGELHSESEIPLTLVPKPADSYGVGKLRDEDLLISNCSHLSILRLMPVYDRQNLQDIKKRVFLPNTKVKIMIRPSPFYSLCNVEEVLIAVKRCIHDGSGQRIIQVGDPQLISQNELASWFSGNSIPVPQLLFRVLVFLLPKRVFLFRTIGFMLKKFGLNNIYEIGRRELKLKET